MKIGIDIDDVIFEFLNSFLDFYNNKKGKKFLKEQFSSYYFWEITGETREEGVKLVDEFHDSELFDSVPPMKESMNALRELSKLHELIFITSRPLSYKEKTLKWLKKNFKDNPQEVVFTGDFHTGKGKPKAKICADLGIDVMIEDNGKYASDCAEKGIHSILITQPWNKDFTHPKVIRVSDWKEIINAVSFLSENPHA